MTEQILAWHFASTQMRDGTPLAAPGGIERYDGVVEMCVSGLHASRLLMDALRYAPGTLLRRVECIDPVEGHDKLVCYERRVLWECDMTAPLRLFARRCALDVAHLWSDQMPDVVREFLMTGDKAAAAAAEAARAAAAAVAAEAAEAAAWAAWAAWAVRAAAARAAAAAAAVAAVAAEAAEAARAAAAAEAAEAAAWAAWAAAVAAEAAEAARASRAARAARAAAALRDVQERRLVAYAQAARAGLFR